MKTKSLTSNSDQKQVRWKSIHPRNFSATIPKLMVLFNVSKWLTNYLWSWGENNGSKFLRFSCALKKVFHSLLLAHQENLPFYIMYKMLSMNNEKLFTVYKRVYFKIHHSHWNESEQFWKCVINPFFVAQKKRDFKASWSLLSLMYI